MLRHNIMQNFIGHSILWTCPYSVVISLVETILVYLHIKGVYQVDSY